eukprot:s737_g1.t1
MGGGDLEIFGLGVVVFGVVGIGLDSGLLFAGGTVGAFDGIAFAGTCFAFGTYGADEEDAATDGLGGGCCGAYDFGVSMRGGALAAASAAALPI